MARAVKKPKALAKKGVARKSAVAGKVATHKTPAKKGAKPTAARKVRRRDPLATALKAHKKALEAVNALQKKLDKAVEAQKKAYARIESIKAKVAAKEAKAATKTGKPTLHDNVEDTA